jgi:hypothetical protein
MEINIQERLNATVHLGTIIADEIGTTTGVWFDTAGYEAMSFHVEGINGETVEIRGSNKPDKPDDSDDEIQMGTDITADGVYAIVTPIGWVKVLINVGGAGSVSVYFLGVPKKTR